MRYDTLAMWKIQCKRLRVVYTDLDYPLKQFCMVICQDGKILTLTIIAVLEFIPTQIG